MGSVGFKEWALVCDALADGRQSIILRKGGIAEGRNGFAFRHPEFFLFPTSFHAQVDKIRSPGVSISESASDEVEIRYFAQVDHVETVTSWQTAARSSQIRARSSGGKVCHRSAGRDGIGPRSPRPALPVRSRPRR